MIIVRILGDLGTQMFQYAYAKALQQKGYQVKIDISKLKKQKLHKECQLNQFKIDLETTTPLDNFLSSIRLQASLKEKSLLFDKKFLELPPKKYVIGNFQTEKYFKTIRAILRKQFVVKKELSNSTINYLKEITIQKNACALHIERTSSMATEKVNETLSASNLRYYQAAIKLIQHKFSDHHFFIFSNDISWAKKNLNIENKTFIEHAVIPHENMHLISLCEHNITANSNFSWWGAWLNQHKNKTVITSKTWMDGTENEFICPNWIQV
ncbi:alpha-1,2-fucosyltransferase [Polaribacter litorisediminis]|uniref:alpha-1,2-fucosyltransferase n=1 Tax=Polaribacter litorisediminis TaxID=1908341 RepID=UPI001CBA799D|nr:alpha-1,2-fucosyltransferase [Polaribacter litorisediminis]UAM96797.1 alpha-1,2-fucosyltransferase [Polaribacter litorisediminis]